MNALRQSGTRTATSLLMSLVVALFLACQGMAMAGTVHIASAGKSGSAMNNMPGCHLMQDMSHGDVASNRAGDNDCQHIVKAFDSGSTAGLVWAYTPAVLPLWASPAEPGVGIPPSALPAHDPVVDPPPTLRLHRFLE